MKPNGGTKQTLMSVTSVPWRGWRRYNTYRMRYNTSWLKTLLFTPLMQMICDICEALPAYNTPLSSQSSLSLIAALHRAQLHNGATGGVSNSSPSGNRSWGQNSLYPFRQFTLYTHSIKYIYTSQSSRWTRVRPPSSDCRVDPAERTQWTTDGTARSKW